MSGLVVLSADVPGGVGNVVACEVLEAAVIEVLQYGSGAPETALGRMMSTIFPLGEAVGETDDEISLCVIGDALSATFGLLSESDPSERVLLSPEDSAWRDRVLQALPARFPPALWRTFEPAHRRIRRARRRVGESRTVTRHAVDPADGGSNFVKETKQSSTSVPGGSCVERREVMYLEAAEHLLLGKKNLAAPLWESIMAEYPSDLLAARLATEHAFNHGQSRHMQHLLSLPVVAECPMNQRSPFYKGMLAFSIVENGDCVTAERLGREAAATAAERNLAHPWAHHAVAHTLEMTGQVEEGIQWLTTRARWWEDCGSFMYTHNWWHVALFHLETDAEDTVLQIYDDHVWGRWKESAQDQAGAAALLWRLQMRQDLSAGSCKIAPGALAQRFADVADFVEPHVRDHLQPFLDLHYAYCLARAGRDERVSDLLDGLTEEKEGETYFPMNSRDVVNITANLARGVVACARGNYEDGYDVLSQTLPNLKVIGGSDAQRDIFEQQLTDAALRTQRFSACLPVLKSRAELRPNSKQTLRLFDIARAGMS